MAKTPRDASGPERAALRLPGVLLVGRFELMARYTTEFEIPAGARDGAALRQRWVDVLADGHRAMRWRLAVTILLGFSLIATAVASALDIAQGLGTAGDANARAAIQGFVGLLALVQAFAGSAAVLLLVARLLLDRYVDAATTAATMLAAQLAAGPG